MKLHKLIKLLFFLSKLKKKLNFLKFKIKIGIYDTCYIYVIYVYIFILFISIFFIIILRFL